MRQGRGEGAAAVRARLDQVHLCAVHRRAQEHGVHVGLDSRGVLTARVRRSRPGPMPATLSNGKTAGAGKGFSTLIGCRQTVKKQLIGRGLLRVAETVAARCAALILSKTHRMARYSPPLPPPSVGPCPPPPIFRFALFHVATSHW